MAKVVNPAVPLGPAALDITGVRAGDRNQITVGLTVGGQPWDLTGKIVTAQARFKAIDIDPPALSALIDVTDAAAGQFSMRWPGEDVRELLDGKPTWKGVWDLQVGEPGQDPLTVAAGLFDAEMDVTRP